MKEMLEDLLLDRRIASFIPDALQWNQDGRISINTRKGLTILTPKPYIPPLKKRPMIEEDPKSSNTSTKKDEQMIKIKQEEQEISQIKQEVLEIEDLATEIPENLDEVATTTGKDSESGKNSKTSTSASKRKSPKVTKPSKQAKKPIPKKQQQPQQPPPPKKKQPQSAAAASSSSGSSNVSQLSDLYIATSHQTTLLQIVNVLFLSVVDNEDIRISQNKSDYRTSLINHEVNLVEMKWSATGIDLTRTNPQSQQQQQQQQSLTGNRNDSTKSVVLTSPDSKQGCLAAFVTDGMNACICRCSSGDSDTSGIALLCNIGEQIVNFERAGIDNTHNGTIEWGTTIDDENEDVSEKINPADWNSMVDAVVTDPVQPIWEPELDERGYPKRRKIDINSILMRDEIKHFRIRSVCWLPEPTNVYSQLMPIDQTNDGIGNWNFANLWNTGKFRVGSMLVVFTEDRLVWVYHFDQYANMSSNVNNGTGTDTDAVAGTVGGTIVGGITGRTGGQTGLNASSRGSPKAYNSPVQGNGKLERVFGFNLNCLDMQNDEYVQKCQISEWLLMEVTSDATTTSTTPADGETGIDASTSDSNDTKKVFKMCCFLAISTSHKRLILKKLIYQNDGYGESEKLSIDPDYEHIILSIRPQDQNQNPEQHQQNDITITGRKGGQITNFAFSKPLTHPSSTTSPTTPKTTGTKVAANTQVCLTILTTGAMHNLTLSANKPKPSFPTKTTLKSLINFDTIVQYVDWSSVDLSSMANSKVLTLNVVVTNSLKDLVIVKLNIGVGPRFN
ncbi:unnamed protein product [Ambrosiozyma monospora]|uniref:Unnamed protein product n=1 Tax=Ambrosiozyma monospora TaxID=43982 RepID=A0ACB5SXJ7_AMBMO|nr:unnamed protein product [Ambrosiozyma monospora]